MSSHSGKFVLRIPRDTHKRLVGLAKERGTSLNQVCVELLSSGLSAKDAAGSQFLKTLNEVVLKLRGYFGENLHGVVLFGSHVTGDATAASDIDLMVVLDAQIERGLYRWWDENVTWDGKSPLNPHFVNLPAVAAGAGGLWLEVAVGGKIIYQKGATLDKLFAMLREFISNGRVRRYISNGHSYWVWRDL